MRLAKLTDAEYVLRQVAGGLEDYYLGSGEAPGVWSGRLPVQLGLVGVVEGDELRALIDRRHPASDERLGGGKQPTVRAIDATFSAPKSVSLLWAFAGPEVASVVSIAHVEAVDAALGFMERQAAVTRRQVGGTRRRAGTSGWAAATFLHRSSRAGDPQLHTHAVIPNLVCREGGAWVALDATALYRWAKAAGSVYQEELRRRLSERLGVGWGPDRNGCREMVGFSEAQLRAFSKRTVQIEAHLAAAGISPADAKARMRADEAASVATRPGKDRTLTPEHLRQRWHTEAAAVGLPTGAALLGQWSTVAHRRVEDRVLHHLHLLEECQVEGVDAAAVMAALAAANRLGDDQAAAVERLCGAGSALRALISPAGYGKTTTLAAATDAARRAGRGVLVVSTTNQAVEQLGQAGVPAMTVARFALCRAELEPGTVVVVDEFSQLPTREAQAALGAAAACPQALVWLVGDPLQAQPVGAGGLAHWIAAQAGQGRLPVAELTVNRRQADPVERQALTHFRHGEITDSQDLRDRAGWNHHHADRDQALTAMAAAVLADVDMYGPERVAALAVSHADCEALADRIRADRQDLGLIGGPALDGPGWSGPRPYQAGDRIVLHAHAPLDDGGRLTNGTVATVTAVTAAGLAVTAADWVDPVVLPAEFVTSRRADGRPQLSHAWARTIDGVQGGTWDQVHLLATPALDRYRGYVGQSRSIQPTHTWNTTPAPIDDHGGRLVQPHCTPAEQIAAAPARAQPKTFAAVDDPYRYDRAVRAEQQSHRQHLQRRPPDLSREIEVAEQVLAARQRDLNDARTRLAHWQTEQQRTGGWRGLTRGRRQQQHHPANQVQFQTGAVERETQRLDAANRQRVQLLDAQATGTAFEEANQWRHTCITALEAELQHHWTQAVLSAAHDGYPSAYGLDKLQAARRTLNESIERLDKGAAIEREESDVARDPVVALERTRAGYPASRSTTLAAARGAPRPPPRSCPVPDGHTPAAASQRSAVCPEASIGVDL